MHTVILDRDVYFKFLVNTKVNVLRRSPKGEGGLEKVINPPFPSIKVHQRSTVSGGEGSGVVTWQQFPSARYKKDVLGRGELAMGVG